MHTLSLKAPMSAAALDEPDPKAGNACHRYAIQYGGPGEVCRIDFMHGPRGVEGYTPGVAEDALLAVVQDRLEAFQAGPFACPENEQALEQVREAREHLGRRVAARMARNVLGINQA